MENAIFNSVQTPPLADTDLSEECIEECIKELTENDIDYIDI
jgi:hypothetical protein